MLNYIRIENLALMNEVSLEFSPGFTVVTGETGAGKSVLLGALSLLSGARADKTVIRQAAQACHVEASLFFDDPCAINRFLDSLGLPLCEDGTLLLKRIVARDKGSRVHINGALAPVAVLQRLGELWVDFHGPGEPQKLFHEKYQLAMLDLFAQVDELLEEYQVHYRQWTDLLQQIEAIKNTDQLNEDELAFVQSQIEAIEAVDPSVESVTALESDFNRLSRLQELSEAAGNLEAGLSSSMPFPELIKKAQVLVEIDPSTAKPLEERLHSLIVELQDLASEYGSLVQEDAWDQEAIQATQTRMHAWLEIKRKYGPDIASVLERYKALKQKVALQTDLEGMLENLNTQAQTEEKKLRSLAENLHVRRVKAAKLLARDSSKLLLSLGFKKAGLQIEMKTEPTLGPAGYSTCQFLFSPNKGQDLLPLNKIASSGETARVMLAFKAVLARADNTPLLVFDEVDANVGGEIGAVVGQELAKLAIGHQVLCVTHLPQVAALGKNHYVVTKDTVGKGTQVTIKAIDQNPQERVTEIARMLGDRESASALSHAEELLYKATQPKAITAS